MKSFLDKTGLAYFWDKIKAWVITVMPDDLADLNDDATHRLVTDTEKSTWNNKGTYSKPNDGIPKTDLTSAVQISLGKADTALQSESDPVFSASAASGITSSDITNWNSKTSNTGTITGVSVNGTSVATSGVANITSMPASILTGAIPSAVTATTLTSGDSSTKIATTAYVLLELEDVAFIDENDDEGSLSPWSGTMVIFRQW